MHECYAMQILEKQREREREKKKKEKKKKKTTTTTTKKNGHKEKSNEVQGPKKPKKIKDTKSHQLLDEVSQTYFYQKVW